MRSTWNFKGPKIFTASYRLPLRSVRTTNKFEASKSIYKVSQKSATLEIHIVLIWMPECCLEVMAAQTHLNGILCWRSYSKVSGFVQHMPDLFNATKNKYVKQNVICCVLSWAICLNWQWLRACSCGVGWPGWPGWFCYAEIPPSLMFLYIFTSARRLCNHLGLYVRMCVCMCVCVYVCLSVNTITQKIINI